MSEITLRIEMWEQRNISDGLLHLEGKSVEKVCQKKGFLSLNEKLQKDNYTCGIYV